MRRSVRSYNGRPLACDIVKELQDYANAVTSPLGDGFSFRLQQFSEGGDQRPGTYGIIKNARDYFLIAYKDDDTSAMNAGYAFEQVVLKATMMGLGTCWMAGTYKGSTFGKDVEWSDGMELHAVCPVGIPAEPRLLERLSRKLMGSSNRKPFGELFFKDNFSDAAGDDVLFARSFEMMRIAPSSTNSQPWRAVVCGDMVHFYCKRRNRVSMIDMGIGLCHFRLAEGFYGNTGEFFTATEPTDVPSGLVYVTSYRRTV